ncbi:DUF1338 domain-containing protein [Gloeobacter kilaueensis]|uniref:2-oxoadipate dioxygenase/decarboxylase n=1 Tax=Gloeobacter kilaueensis (strain ATCC BAA-2537 / CCAP 1431/1 / ULC 316 / JS1) TaxID=1183438 RepID=U5QQM5_GLOK1|nr:DUF1338 domain-containing protein [Gloeobacter kilaueensis]AGY59919.1 hypothetical protein GKIL_3673 [Gloeobacter kilaueensis JS1]
MNGTFARALWERLWKRYQQRVSYARVYQEMIEQAGGTVANDHIAFRSLRLSSGGQDFGIGYLERFIEPLGYVAAGEYVFSGQHLCARHYQHPEQEALELPKLFVSELLVDDLSEPAALAIRAAVEGATLVQTARTLEEYEAVFSRPWQPPRRSAIEVVNSASQYGAWVLLHGYAVNHFTGYVNRQNTERYFDIESTAQGLAERGVPMKSVIEGDWGSGLRQTATRAVSEPVTVLDDGGRPVEIPWTYAYYEIAERGTIEVAPGRRERFDGFLGPQAKNLFEMTRKESSSRPVHP